MSHDRHTRCDLHITREALRSTINEVLDAWDMYDFEVAKELVERITAAASTSCSIPIARVCNACGGTGEVDDPAWPEKVPCSACRPSRNGPYR